MTSGGRTLIDNCHPIFRTATSLRLQAHLSTILTSRQVSCFSKRTKLKSQNESSASNKKEIKSSTVFQEKRNIKKNNTNVVAKERSHIKESGKEAVLFSDLNISKNKVLTKFGRALLTKGSGPIISSIVQTKFLDVVQKTDSRNLESLDYQDTKNYVNVNPFFTSTHISSCAADRENVQLSKKELLFMKMLMKYQFPCPMTTTHLTSAYPDAESLVKESVSSFISAGLLSSLSPIFSSHLKGLYWKATLKLPLPWHSPICVTGMHPVKDQALTRAYLLFCLELQKLGLLRLGNDGKWQPMDCSHVINMLDKMAIFGEMAIGRSKGRGFKFVLDQVKDLKTSNGSTSFSGMSEDVGTLCSPEENDSLQWSQQLTKKSAQTNSDDMLSCTTHLEGDNLQEPNKLSCSSSPSFINERTQTSEEGVQVNSREFPSKKLNWKCSVHVGWPLPFSVHVYGVSLPSAQMLGCMAVATSLKQKHLLDRNNTIPDDLLQYYVVHESKKRFINDSKRKNDAKEEVNFKPEAIIYCDASKRGLGSYMISADSKNLISWISDPWESHSEVYEYLSFINKRGRTTLYCSNSAEIFSLVTAIFTWKKKLRHRKVLLYMDNTNGVGLVNSYGHTQVPIDICKDFLDLMIHYLQFVRNIYHIQIHAVWLQRDKNQLADALARQDLKTFLKTFPNAHKNKTKSKKLQFYGRIHWRDKR